MADVFHFLIVHGAYGRPEGNWFPWLKNVLEKDGHKVAVPRFPTPEGQTYDVWRKIAVAALATFPPDKTILIGHSIGAAFALRLAEEVEHPYKAVFAVAPFVSDLGLPEFDTINATFLHHPFDWDRVSCGAGKIVCMAGDNDPYVPLGHAEEAAELARADLHIVPKGGHLNAEAGYCDFPLLLEKIRQVL